MMLDLLQYLYALRCSLITKCCYDAAVSKWIVFCLARGELDLLQLLRLLFHSKR